MKPKIGVALSGCDIGGVGAWAALKEFESQGFYIEMISASGMPSVAALLYANAYAEDAATKLLDDFLRHARESDIDSAIADLSARFRESGEKKALLCVNAVDVTDGEVIAFAEGGALCGENLKTFSEAETYDILSATVSLTDGLGCYHYGGRRLCDYCCWYGCPVHQLRLAGMEKVVSMAFLPEKPKTPYEALSKRMITCFKCPDDIHITIELADKALSLQGYAEIAAGSIKNRIDEIAPKLLF